MESTGRFTPALRKLVHYSYNVCSSCGATFPPEMPAFAGYETGGRELYVGNCCKSKLDELASHIYWWWTQYKRPTENTPLLRFMDFSKFAALLKDRSVWFARADTLGDQFEGARGVKSREAEYQAYMLDHYRRLMRNPPPGAQPPSEEIIEREAQRLYRDWEAIGKRGILRTFVSCWHSQAIESEALWRLYCPPGSAGVCVRTTFGKLDPALRTKYEVRFGHVLYIDFKERYAGTHDRIFWKRNSLSHEAEVRAVIEVWPEKADTSEELGLNIPVDLSTFAQEVLLSPFAPAWFEDVLKETLHRYGVALSVSKSALVEEPFF